MLGVGLVVAGACMLTSSITVTRGAMVSRGDNAFGLSRLLFIFGIGLWFLNGRLKLGWLLLFAKVVIIFTGIIMNLHVYIQPTSLFSTLLILVLLARGVDLVASPTHTLRSSFYHCHSYQPLKLGL